MTKIGVWVKGLGRDKISNYFVCITSSLALISNFSSFQILAHSKF
jgi:hypothetical protein